MVDNTSERGFGSDNTDKETKHEIQSKGGKASGGNFANDPERAREAGQKSSGHTNDHEEHVHTGEQSHKNN